MLIGSYNVGARIYLLTVLSDSNSYNSFSYDVDKFMYFYSYTRYDMDDFIVITAAGKTNSGSYDISLYFSGSIYSPGSCKNCISVGCSKTDFSTDITTIKYFC